jgi:hypothetical protein
MSTQPEYPNIPIDAYADMEQRYEEKPTINADDFLPGNVVSFPDVKTGKEGNSINRVNNAIDVFEPEPLRAPLPIAEA